MFKIYLRLLLLCIAAAGAPPGRAAPVRFVGDIDFPPFSFQQNGRAQGIDVDIIRELARRAQFDVEIELQPWARVIESVKSGDADGGFAFFYADNREAFSDYISTPLHYSEYHLYTTPRKQFTFKRINDLHDKTIGLQRNFIISDEFDLAIKRGKIKLREMKNVEQLIKVLSVGRIDAFPGNSLVVEHYARQMKVKLIRLDKTIRYERGAYLVLSQKARIKYKNTLFLAMEEKMVEMSRDGTLDNIIDRYRSQYEQEGEIFQPQ